MTTVVIKEPTERQLQFLYRLAGERAVPSLGSCGEERIENMGARVENKRDAGVLDRALVSSWIDWLLGQPYDPAEQPERVSEPGVYEVPGEGIFVVKPNQARTNLYAKKLVEINGDRINHNGVHVRFEFEYAPGAMNMILPSHQMSIERAKELTLRYGRCINCGRKLKAGVSVERGIGPVCIKRFRSL